MSQPTVHGDLKFLQEEWLAAALTDFDKARAKELAKIDMLEEIAMYDLQLTRKQTRVVKPKKGDKDQTERVVETECPGDTAYHEVIRKYVELRVKLLGLAPKEKDTNVNFIQMNWDQLAERPSPEDDEVERKIAAVNVVSVDGKKVE